MAARLLAAVSVFLILMLTLVLGACSSHSLTADAVSPRSSAPAGVLSGLPALPALATLPVRGVSDSSQERAGDLLVEKNDAVTVDNVNHQSSFDTSGTKLGYTIQDFDVSDTDRVGSLSFEFSGVGNTETVWVALSDYTTQSWKIVQLSSDNEYSLDLGGLAGVYSNGSKMFVAVLGYQARFNLLLARLGLASDFYPGWIHRWGDAGLDYAARVALDPDGNILYAGTYDSASAGQDDTARLGLLKLSPAGALLEARTFQIFDDTVLTERLDFGDLLVAGDGSIYLCGRASGTAVSDDGVVIKLDKDFNLLWSKRYDAGGKEDLLCAALKSDGNLICAGNSDGSPTTLSDDAWVFEVNGSSGDLTSSRVYEVAGTTENFNYIDLDETGGKLHLGGSMDGGSNFGEAYMATLNLSDFNLDWAAQYGTSDFDGLTALSHGADNSTIIAAKLGSDTTSTLLQVASDGSLTQECGYTDTDGSTGIFVVRMIYNQAAGGPLVGCGRSDGQGGFVGGLTTLLQFDGDMTPTSGLSYGWYFADWLMTPGSLYTSGFTASSAVELAATSNVSGPSLTDKTGAGSFVSVTPTVTTPGSFASLGNVTMTTNLDRFDGEFANSGDYDWAMVRYIPPST